METVQQVPTRSRIALGCPIPPSRTRRAECDRCFEAGRCLKMEGAVMGVCFAPTPEMGEYSIEVRQESFVLRGEDSVDERRRHALDVYANKTGQGSVEILTEDIPKIKAALTQVENNLGLRDKHEISIEFAQMLQAILKAAGFEIQPSTRSRIPCVSISTPNLGALAIAARIAEVCLNHEDIAAILRTAQYDDNAETGVVLMYWPKVRFEP